MKKILVLGSSFGCPEIIIEAKRRNLYTIVTDFLPYEKSLAKQLSDEYWMISTGEVDVIKDRIIKEQINYIAAGISEFNIEKAIEISSDLKLPCFCSYDTWHFSRHKGDFKKLCEKNGVLTAKYYNKEKSFKDLIVENIDFPVVVKPVDNSGNFGMSYCYAKKDLKNCYEYAVNNSDAKEVVVEQMLIGREYIAHYLITKQSPALSAFYVMLSQPGYPSNCYSFTTSCVDCTDDYINEMNDNVVGLLKNANCTDGVAWVEMIRHSDGHFYALELAERPTGDLIDIPYKKLTNFDTFSWLLDTYVGIFHNETDLPKKEISNFLDFNNKEFANSYILFSNKKSKIKSIEGFFKLNEINDLGYKLLVNENDYIEEHNYLAVIFFSSNSFEEMCSTLTFINNNIKIYNYDDENIVIYYNDFESLNNINNNRKGKCKNNENKTTNIRS